MQASQTRTTYQPGDLGQRVHFPYYAWMRGEGIPIYEAMGGVEDTRHIERAPWAGLKKPKPLPDRIGPAGWPPRRSDVHGRSC